MKKYIGNYSGVFFLSEREVNVMRKEHCNFKYKERCLIEYYIRRYGFSPLQIRKRLNFSQTQSVRQELKKGNYTAEHQVYDATFAQMMQ